MEAVERRKKTRRQSRKDGGDDEERRQKIERGDIRQAVSVSAGIFCFLLSGRSHRIRSAAGGDVSQRNFHTRPKVQGQDGVVTGR